jgi:hypothetical protein
MIMPTEKTTVHTDDTNKTSAETAHTVDGEGLLNNYAAVRILKGIEPEMYEEDGKFLAIEIGDDREASQAQHVLEKAGHTLDSSN